MSRIKTCEELNDQKGHKKTNFIYGQPRLKMKKTAHRIDDAELFDSNIVIIVCHSVSFVVRTPKLSNEI